jgi:hypothetical protein
MTKGGKLLAGIELVEISETSELTASQIEDDLRAVKSIQIDGISISWDLWHIPLKRLEIVSDIGF